MDDMTRFEERFADRLRAFARTGVQSVDSAAVARAVAAGHPRSAATRPPAVRRPGIGVHRTRERAVFGPWRTRSMFRPSLAAAAVVAVLVSGALLVTRPDQPAITDPSPSLPGVVAPSSAPSATPPDPSTFPRTTGFWIATGRMGTPRSGHTAVRLLDGRVLVVGGADENETSAELYDPDTGTWSATGSMIKPRGGLVGATLLRDGKVLVGDVEGAEVYDPEVGTWSATGTMAVIDPDGSSHWGAATLLPDGRALVVHDVGGSELYDPDSGTWTATGQLTPPVAVPTPVTLPDGRVLVAGGEGTSRDGNRAALYDPATGTWTATGTMGTPRLEHLAVPLLDGRVLVVGGGFDDQNDTSAEVYDPATGTWSATGSMLRPHGRFPATVLDDGRVLVGDADGAQLYDPDSGTWTDAEKMVMPTSGSATLLLDGTVLVAGSGGSAELYIPAGVSPPPAAPAAPSTGAWIPTGTMGTPRSGSTVVRLLDGRVLVVGGSGGESDPSVAELYGPDTGIWTATGNMTKRRACFPATLLRDGKVLAGVVDLGDDGETGAEVYDPATGTWSTTGKMAIRSDCGLSATLLLDGKVLVAGREGSQLYNPDSGTWAATGSMVAPPDGFLRRRGGAATLLPDGRVLVAGGGTDNQRFDTAELYDPDRGTWTAIAAMNSPKAGPTATLLRDGNVLVTGSDWVTDSGYVFSAEVYDPATGTWTPTEEFARPAYYGSATLLSDGKVLVADEYGAELYDPGTGSWTTTAYPLRGHDSPLPLLLDGTVLAAGGRDCLGSVCVATGSAELYVPAGVSPPPLPAFPSPPPTVFPSPTPVPTPYPPEAGPVPTNARSWQIKVVNKSAKPATLFVAEEDERGTMARLAGNVTPHVVPPGATVQVTLLLPAKGVDGWSIWVNPGPDLGGLVGWTDLALGGEIYIGPEGQVGWLPEDQLPRP